MARTAPVTSPADPPTALEDCRKLCRVRLRALCLAFGLKPIVQLVTVCPSALLVKFVGTLLNLLLNRDQDGRLVRPQRESSCLWFHGGIPRSISFARNRLLVSDGGHPFDV